SSRCSCSGNGFRGSAGSGSPWSWAAWQRAISPRPASRARRLPDRLLGEHHIMLALALLVALQQQPAALPALTPQGGDTSPFRRLGLPAPSSSAPGADGAGPADWPPRVGHGNRAPLECA